MNELLLKKAKNLPDEPGCYLMKAEEKILYVGKAKNLKKRVCSYFQEGAKGIKTEYLIKKVDDFAFIVTRSEAEALILENNLIKEHNPKYNIRLKDDKSYPYIEIDYRHPFPMPRYARRPKRVKGKKLYGPFPQGSAAGEVLRFLRKMIRLRDCHDQAFSKATRPCLLFQIDQCTAPCVDKVSKDDYALQLNLFERFFAGDYRRVLSEFQKMMEDAAESEAFERAAELRDGIHLLEKFVEMGRKNLVELEAEKDFDVIGIHEGSEEIDLAIMMIRGGLLLAHKNIHFQKTNMDELEEELTSAILMHYESEVSDHPPVVYTTLCEESLQLLGISLSFPFKTVKGKMQGLCELAKTNASNQAEHRIKEKENGMLALFKLKELLSLPSIPRKLECVDIAVFQGSSPTASQIVFIDGKASKKDYRHYNLEERPEGNNDFAMMEEFVRRRVKHGELPDVLVLDGGGPQLRAVVAVLEELEILIPVVGIAKERDNKDERLVIPGRSNPFILSRHRELHKLLATMRDEAHRFARRLHHKKEKERLFQGSTPKKSK